MTRVGWVNKGWERREDQAARAGAEQTPQDKGSAQSQRQGEGENKDESSNGHVPVDGEQSTTMGLRVPEVRGELERKVSYSMDKGRGALKGLSKSRHEHICIFD